MNCAWQVHFSHSPFCIKKTLITNYSYSPYEQHRIAPEREAGLQAKEGILKKGAHLKFGRLSGVVSKIDQEPGEVLGATSCRVALVAEKVEDSSRMERAVREVVHRG